MQKPCILPPKLQGFYTKCILPHIIVSIKLKFVCAKHNLSANPPWSFLYEKKSEKSQSKDLSLPEGYPEVSRLNVPLRTRKSESVHYVLNAMLNFK